METIKHDTRDTDVVMSSIFATLPLLVSSLMNTKVADGTLQESLGPASISGQRRYVFPLHITALFTPSECTGILSGIVQGHC